MKVHFARFPSSDVAAIANPGTTPAFLLFCTLGHVLVAFRRRRRLVWSRQTAPRARGGLGPIRFVPSSVKDGLSLSTAYFVSLSGCPPVHRPKVGFQLDLPLHSECLRTFHSGS